MNTFAGVETEETVQPDFVIGMDGTLLVRADTSGIPMFDAMVDGIRFVSAEGESPMFYFEDVVAFYRREIHRNPDPMQRAVCEGNLRFLEHAREQLKAGVAKRPNRCRR